MARENEFKAWLKQGGASAVAGGNTRAYAVRTIERKLDELGMPFRDLDEAWEADRFDSLSERLRSMREDARNGGQDYRILMPDSENPLKRLSSWRSWLAQFGRFLGGEPPGSARDADRIRQYVLEHYIEPAQEEGRGQAEVLVRDVNTALGLNEAWPNICQALAGRKFRELAQVPPPERIGADQSPATVFRFTDRRVFKMSIGEANNPEDAHLFEEAMAGGYALLGFEDINWSDDKYVEREAIIKEIIEAYKKKGRPHTDVNASSGAVQMPFIFRNWVRPGDIVVVSKGNSLFRAIGEFTGDYEFHSRPEGGYAHRRPVRWHWVDREGVSVGEIYTRRFSQKSIYQLFGSELNVPSLERYLNSQQTDGPAEPESFVLIIDEINRANISKVFGELITLLEPDKRLVQPNALKVRLPYSGDNFGGALEPPHPGHYEHRGPVDCATRHRPAPGVSPSTR